MQARLAAQTRWARTEDRSAATRPARAALAAKWAESPDPTNAMRAHMTAMALAASRAASRRRATAGMSTDPGAA